MLPLLDFCRYAQRMGASRRISYRTWAEHTPGTSWEEFCAFWEAARNLEARQEARR